jgi:hypothetical protein
MCGLETCPDEQKGDFFMKKVMCILGIMVLAGMFLACGDDNSENAPRYRVQNLQAGTINVSMKTSDGNTVNINNVVSGATTDWRTMTTGTNEATSSAFTNDCEFISSKGKQYTVQVQVNQTATIQTEDQ